MQHSTDFLHIAPHIKAALAQNQPVVALESTIISHGMPYPKNVETALAVEAQVRAYGAIPATIAIIKGKMTVGLTTEEIDLLGKTGHDVAKVSRRDVATLLARGENGATTVASTMIIAGFAGIKIFATGGIGGVHRGAGDNFDISADLQELARTNVAVVCAGAKSILDIGLTLEYLETFGVPVLGYQTDEFPAFFTPKSGFKVDYKVDTPTDLAKILATKWALPLQGGVVIAQPVPEAHAADPYMIQEAIETALAAADAQNVKGKAITPFLLAAIEARTQGLSLKTNIELVLNNAALAAQTAVALSAIG